MDWKTLGSSGDLIGESRKFLHETESCEGCGIQMSHEKKKRGPLLSIESWMVNRDPYFMVYYNPYITG